MGNRYNIVVILLLVCIFMVACVNIEDEPDISINTNDKTEIIEMSETLTEAMHTSPNFDDMKDTFDYYKDNMNETTFKNYFNVADRLVAIIYHTEAHEVNYELLETIEGVSSNKDETLDNIYVVCRVERIYEDDSYDEPVMVEDIFTEVYKYIYRDNKLVGFKKIT